MSFAYIDKKKIKALTATHKRKLIAWLTSHENTNTNQVAYLKEIYTSSKFDMDMLSTFKSVAKNGYHYVLRGRGGRQGLNYNAKQTLRAADAERFSLYVKLA